MTEIDYGRLDALEAALGGRAAIEALYRAKQTYASGSGGSGSPTVYVWLSIQTRDSSAGADLMVPVSNLIAPLDNHSQPNRARGVAPCGPITFAPFDDATPFIAFPDGLPAGASIACTYAELFASNAAGTEKLNVGSTNASPIPLVHYSDRLFSQNFLNSDYAFSTLEQIGTDLSLFTGAAGFPTENINIESAAGGQFFLSFWAAFEYTPPA